MTKKTSTGYKWDVIKNLMETEDWTPTEDGDGVQRTVFLGSLINPSGKYYLPFACSNLNPCPQCGGSGKIKRAKARLIKKLSNAIDQHRAKYRERKSFWRLPGLERARLCRISSTDLFVERARLRLETLNAQCERCGGCGSHEAHDDEVFWEMLEKEAEAHGYSIMSGEGDPCDTFVVEYRDIPDDEDEPDEETCDETDDLSVEFPV